MQSFEVYLQEHGLDPLLLSRRAGVRYLTVWNAMKGKPIRHAHAIQLIETARVLTGVLYTGTLPLFLSYPLEQAPTAPIAVIRQDVRQGTMGAVEERRLKRKETRT